MKKIMFNDKYGLTKSVLDGRKTMTRRILKADINDHNAIRMSLLDDEENQKENRRAIIKKYSRYQIGEVVAVVQRYKDIIGDRVFFVSSETGVSVHRSVMEREKGWTNKMNVAAEFMPHRIRITNIKVERLKDISSEDCLKEGIEARIVGCHTFYYIDGVEKPFVFPKHAFGALIDKVSGKGTWERNPWVFVYEFELLKGRKDYD